MGYITYIIFGNKIFYIKNKMLSKIPLNPIVNDRTIIM